MLMKPFLSFLLFVSIGLFAQDQIPERPNPPKLVNIFFNESHDFLSDNQIQQLEYKLDTFATNTSNQICIVAIDDLQGIEPAQYATWLGQKWGVGQKDKRNGVVILVKLPSQKDSRRNLFIATGYGLEGAIPDLLTKKIREQEILPYFKTGDFYTGLDQGTNTLMSAAKGDYDEKIKKNESGSWVSFVIIILIILLIMYIKNKRGGYSSSGGFTYWGGGFGGGGYDSGSSSDSGSSFDFGGGDFGGGGSGGDW